MSSSSSTRNNISAAGTITNLLSIGFTQSDAVGELIDNSLDAGAQRVRIRLDTSAHTFHEDDDGKGMDKEQLTGALCINNARPASETIGTKGLGLKAAHCVLSNEEYPTVIISKTANSSTRHEIDADWPTAIRNNHWDPHAARGSEDYRPLWDAGCLNPEHGTTMRIPMPPEEFKKLLACLPELRKEIGRTYEKFINAGKMICVEVDGVSYAPDMSTALGWEGTPAHLRNEVPLEMFRNPTTGEKRIYYRHTYARKWTDMVRNNPDPTAKKEEVFIRDRQTAADDGFVLIASMTLKSAYRPEWNPPMGADGERPTYMPGYLAPCRDGRYLRPLFTEFGASGDYEARRVSASARHSLEFSHLNDDLFDIQVNKSNMTPANIDPLLLSTVRELTKKWVSKVYNANFKVQVLNPNAAFDRAVNAKIKQVREIANANREIFLEEFEQMLEELRERLDARYEMVDEDVE